MGQARRLCRRDSFVFGAGADEALRDSGRARNSAAVWAVIGTPDGDVASERTAVDPDWQWVV